MGGGPVDYLQEQPRSWTRGYREQHQLVVRTGFEPATYGFQIQPSNHSATLPPKKGLSPEHRSDVLCPERHPVEASTLCACWNPSKLRLLPHSTPPVTDGLSLMNLGSAGRTVVPRLVWTEKVTECYPPRPPCSNRLRRLYCPFPEGYDVGEGGPDSGVMTACLLLGKPSKLEWLPWVPNNWCVVLPPPRSSVPPLTFHCRLRPSPVRMHRYWW